MKDLKILLEGSFPLIHICSREYDRVFNEILVTIKSSSKLSDCRIFTFDSVEGLNSVILETNTFSLKKVSHVKGNIVAGILEFLNYVTTDAILIVKNLNLLWERIYYPQESVELIDILYHLYQRGTEKGLTLINIGSGFPPSELRDYFAIIDFPLPTEEIIKQKIAEFSKSNRLKIPEEAVSYLKGLSNAEIENTLVISYLSTPKDQTELSLTVIKEEKMKVVKKSGLLELLEPVEEWEVGGLDVLKEWLKRVAYTFHNRDKAKAYGILPPKGCVLCGIPGTGKTLTAKAIAKMFGVPLFRLDIGRLFGKYVGDTEENTRETFKLIEAMAPCVVVIDEIEKALAGAGTNLDSGVTTRLVGSFLYHTQERKEYVYYVCTANNISALPPELLRKGRFDEVWYVGLPSMKERANIWQVHLKKSGRNLKAFDYKKLVASSEGFTGSEIEACISQTLYKTFYEQREPTTADFLETLKEITPFSVMKADYVRNLERWAAENNIKRANAMEEKNGRKIS